MCEFEHPIIFSGESVRAILAGRKTQTRRVVKSPVVYGAVPHGDEWLPVDGEGCTIGDLHRRFRCPYGKPGDRLWVRETWASPEENKKRPGRVAYDADGVCGCWIGGGEDRDFIYHGRILQASGYHECFPADGATTFGLGKYTDIRSGEYPSYRYGWRPSIFMPRWASRITLELTGVRVEQVQDISEADAWSEGVRPEGGDAIAAFAQLWDGINGKRGFGWYANPCVWVLKFRRVEL